MKKILWFANSPCGAKKKLLNQPITSGGWLSSLAECISERTDIELHIAFYWGTAMSPFKFEGITYHPILRNGYGSKLGRYLYRLKQQYFSHVNDNEIDRVEKVVKEVNPDLIHFHGSEENFGLVAERIKDIPMVLSIQGLLSPYYYKLYSGYQKSDVLKGERFLTKLLHDGYGGNDRRMYKRTFTEQKIFKLVDNIIGRTAWDRDCSLALNPHRKYFVCNEILRSEFFSSEWHVPNTSNFVLATTISNGLYKGLEMIFQSANLLSKQNINFEWNVIGIAAGDKFERVTRRITGINPENVHINFLGRKNAKEIVDILNKSNAFIQVSHIENSPNSLCEAMALGMPIVASYAGGTISLIEDGKEGVLVQDGDPYRLAGSIINMKNDYEHAVEMGLVARNKALLRHSPENVLQELSSIYSELL